MSAVDALVKALTLVLDPGFLPYIVFAILIGIFFGSLPGIGSILGMVILLPLSVHLDGVLAVVMLASIYVGGMYGASISGIVLNVPGSPAAIATALEGYPMSRKGKSLDALAASASASAVGGVFAAILLVILSPIMLRFLRMFGTPEYFLMAMLGIALIAVVVQGSLVKGIVSGFFGLLLTTIGIAPIRPETRVTFGIPSLYDGLSFVAITIGLFAIAEMIRLGNTEGGIAEEGSELSGNLLEGVKKTFQHPVSIVKSIFIGIGVGSLPGTGAEVSNFFAYGEAIRSLPDRGEWGDGDIRGVIASESSNSSTVGGALLPTLAFGVPGGAAAAVLLGGLIMHGISPGPDLFDPSENLYITYSILVGMIVGAVVILVVGLGLITRLSRLTMIDTDFIVPVIVVLAVVGVFALRRNWVDVATVLFIGYVGWYMKEYSYSLVALVMGAVLGTIAERNFHRSLAISDQPFDVFYTRPQSLLILVLIFVILFGPYLKERLDLSAIRGSS